MFTQEMVMMDYKGSSVFHKKERAEECLHMFFSPWRVPVGLTDEEVAICVLLHHFRKIERERLVILAVEHNDPSLLMRQRTLPEEFRPDKVMTRARFKKGLYKYLVQISQ